jgi:hypothetical protein
VHPVRVLLVTDDFDLVSGVSATLARNPSIGAVDRVGLDDPWLARGGCADLVVVDTRQAMPSPVVFTRNGALCPDARVLLLVRREEMPLELGPDVHPSGYVQPDDAGEIAPVVLALAALSGSDA